MFFRGVRFLVGRFLLLSVMDGVVFGLERICCWFVWCYLVVEWCWDRDS